MVIDVHAHIGNGFGIQMSEQMILDSLNKYHVDYTLVSNADGCEFDDKNTNLHNELTQNEINMRSINFARTHKDKIGVLLWAKLYSGACDNEFYELAQTYKDVVYGIKIHPFYSGIHFCEEKTESYIQLASEFRFPVLVHTARDNYSRAKYVFKMAKKYPDVNFIMSHLEFGSNNKEAIGYLKERKNLYTDTAWIRPTIIEEIIREIGCEKVMFGSDNPTLGIDTYSHNATSYIYLNSFHEWVSEEVYKRIMYQNAIDFFGITYGR